MRVVPLVVVVALAGLAVPASGESMYPDGDAVPTIRYPLPTTRVHVEGTPGGIWGMRVVARWVGERTGLRVWTRGPCARHPRAVCVHVEADDYGETGWAGITHWGGDPTVIYLNERGYDSFTKRSLAAHEFLHALRMGHHQLEGAVSTSWHPYPTRPEMRVLRSTYGEAK